MTRHPKRAWCVLVSSVAVLWAAAAPALAQDRPPEKPAPVMERREVDWPAVARSLNERRLLRIPPTQKLTAANLDNCRIPVLLPMHGNMAGEMRVFAQPDSYAAFLDRGTHTVEVMGTRLARSAAAPQARLMSRRMEARALSADTGRYVITRTDYGVDLSFGRYGAAYTVSLVCTAGARDPICGEDAYVKGLMTSMAFAGGRPESGEAMPRGTLARPEGER